MMKTIFVFLADGFEEIEAITPIDVLRRAGLNVQTVSVMEEQIVAGAHGIPVVADKMFADIHLEDAEMLLLPGGLPGATNLDAHQGLSDMIMAFASEGKALAAICAAPLVFGNRGLLQGKKATCYPGFEKQIPSGIFTDSLVEVGDNIVTGRGPAATLQFAYTLLDCLGGDSNPLQEGMQYTYLKDLLKK